LRDKKYNYETNAGTLLGENEVHYLKNKPYSHNNVGSSGGGTFFKVGEHKCTSKKVWKSFFISDLLNNGSNSNCAA